MTEYRELTYVCRVINYSGSYSTNQGSYLAVYGWINSPLTGKFTRRLSNITVTEH
jgi:hypothetical protein